MTYKSRFGGRENVGQVTQTDFGRENSSDSHIGLLGKTIKRRMGLLVVRLEIPVCLPLEIPSKLGLIV